MIRYRVKVTGRVQGVFFRASTVEQAESLELTGWVCNRADGGVLFEAQGLKDKVEQLIEWSRTGPRMAKVTGVTLDIQEVIPEQAFVIRY